MVNGFDPFDEARLVPGPPEEPVLATPSVPATARVQPTLSRPTTPEPEPATLRPEELAGTRQLPPSDIAASQQRLAETEAFATQAENRQIQFRDRDITRLEAGQEQADEQAIEAEIAEQERRFARDAVIANREAQFERRDARARIAKNKLPEEWTNPFSKLGFESGKMARLRIMSRNPYRIRSPEQGAAIVKVIDVARGVRNEPVTAEELQTTIDLMTRNTGQITPHGRKENITTSTRQEVRVLRRLEQMRDQQLSVGLAKVQERLANKANPILNLDQWEKLMADSFPNLTSGIGRQTVAPIMPPLLAAQERVDQANQPFFRQWLRRPGVANEFAEDLSDDKIEEIAGSINAEGSLGEQLYREFQDDSESGAFFLKPDGKVGQQLASKAVISARLKAQKTFEAQLKLGASFVTSIDPADDAQLEALAIAGVNRQGALRFKREQWTEIFEEIEKEVADSLPKDQKIFPVKLQGKTAIDELVRDAVRDYDGGSSSIETAIKKTISDAVDRGLISGATKQQAYVAMRMQIRSGMQTLYDREVDSGRRNINAGIGQQLQNFAVELGEFSERFRRDSDAAIGMTVGIENEADIPKKAAQWIRAHFPNLSDVDREYLERGLHTSQVDTDSAIQNFNPVWDVFEQVSDTMRRGFETLKGEEARRREIEKFRRGEDLRDAQFDFNKRALGRLTFVEFAAQGGAFSKTKGGEAIYFTNATYKDAYEILRDSAKETEVQYFLQEIGQEGFINGKTVDRVLFQKGVEGTLTDEERNREVAQRPLLQKALVLVKGIRGETAFLDNVIMTPVMVREGDAWIAKTITATGEPQPSTFIGEEVVGKSVVMAVQIELPKQYKGAEVIPEVRAALRMAQNPDVREPSKYLKIALAMAHNSTKSQLNGQASAWSNEANRRVFGIGVGLGVWTTEEFAISQNLFKDANGALSVEKMGDIIVEQIKFLPPEEFERLREDTRSGAVNTFIKDMEARPAKAVVSIQARFQGIGEWSRSVSAAERSQIDAIQKFNKRVLSALELDFKGVIVTRGKREIERGREIGEEVGQRVIETFFK